jgi:alkanesulfonate monooxygenase SsuD/methylene tetrahydromethanopterin reductase-like flavin-dependent oxidoreductase (luciferase family)
MELYRSALGRAGLDEAAIEERLDWSFCQKQVIVRGTDEEAREEAFRRIALLVDTTRLADARTAHLKADSRMRTSVNASNTDAGEFFEKAFIVGSPATVSDELQRYADAGIRHLALYFNFSYMSSEEADVSIDLFMDEVFPHFDAGAATGDGLAAAPLS